MDQVLVGLGVAPENITVAKNLSYTKFLTTLIDFRAGLAPDDAVLFYFSGHGFSIEGDDYLAPVDFSLSKTKDIARRSSIGVAQVVAYLANNKSRVIVLDACRTDAPLLKRMVSEPPKMDLGPLISIDSSGSLIAYSTSAGKASDARSASGLSFYTQFLVNSLAARPRDMLTALNNAKAATSDASAGKQVPAVYDEMVGSFDLFKGTTPEASSSRGPASSPRGPRLGSGLEAYRTLSDEQVGQWVMEESDKIAQMISDSNRNAAQARRAGRTGDGDLFAFDGNFGACCRQDLMDLHSEVIDRLGPPAKNAQEEMLWRILLPTLQNPHQSPPINIGLLQHYLRSLRLLGLKLKRRAVPRNPSIDLRLQSQQVASENKYFSFELILTISTEKEITSGYVVVLFNEGLVVTLSDFVDSTSAFPGDGIDNKALEDLLEKNDGKSLALKIGKTPFTPQIPIHVKAFGKQPFRTLSASWFDE